MQVNISHQPRSIGMSPNGNAGGHNLKLLSSIEQQIISNENFGRISKRTATIINGNAHHFGELAYITLHMLMFHKLHPSIFHSVIVWNYPTMVLRLQVRLSSFPLARMLKAPPAIGNSEGLENGTNLKVSTSVIPSYNHFNEHHINDEDWDLQNLNITYYVYELYDKQS